MKHKKDSFKKIQIAEFIKSTQIMRIDEDGILFADGSRLNADHSQDCCESVYADWKALINTTPTTKIKTIAFSIVPNSGITLYFTGRDKYGFDIESHPCFVPCYNRQNGYYSSNLNLSISSGNIAHSFDISEGCHDDID